MERGVGVSGRNRGEGGAGGQSVGRVGEGLREKASEREGIVGDG